MNQTNHAAAVADNGGDIRKALGLPVPYLYAGKLWQLRPLTIFDMAELGARFVGRPESEIFLHTDSILFSLYLMLRKADPDLTFVHRERRQFNLTIDDVEQMFSIKNDAEEMGAFVVAIQQASGLLKSPEEIEEDAAEAAKQSGAKKNGSRPRSRRTRTAG